MPRILVIDEDRAVLQAVRQAFNKTGIQVLTARSAGRGLALAAQRRPDLVVHGLSRSPDGDWTPLDHWRQQHPRTPLIVVASSNGNQAVIEAAKRGAYDFFWKPLDYGRLREQVRDAVASSLSEQGRGAANRAAGGPHADVLLGSSTPMQELYREIGRAALADVAVLLIGETGSGKSAAARAIHRHGTRRDERFSTVDPAGIPVERLEHELFGYEPGAFARAPSRRIGWLERSFGGTLLLKQVEQLPPRVQGQLVGLFEQGRIQRVGGAPIAADLRILATTRRELEPMVAAGRFRPDLYYYLRGFAIRVPPLRERLDDLAELVDYFWTRLGLTTGAETPKLGPDLLEVLVEYRWPGNLWELQSVVCQTFWRSRGRTPSLETLPERVRPASKVFATGTAAPPAELASLDELIAAAMRSAEASDLYAACVALFNQYICSRVLTHTGGNQSRAARILGMTRRSLRTKIRRWTETPVTARKGRQPKVAAKRTPKRSRSL